MKLSMSELSARLPGPPSGAWPQGERFMRGFAHGTMSVELYAPRGHDPQTPHAQDELYFVMQGRGELRIGDACHDFEAGDAFFVPAGMPHRFGNFTDDFAAWVVFWGPQGGEQ